VNQWGLAGRNGGRSCTACITLCWIPDVSINDCLLSLLPRWNQLQLFMAHIAPPCRLHCVVGQAIKFKFFLKVGRYRFQENVFGFRVASFEEIFPVRLQETGPVKSAPLVFYEEFNGLKILETGLRPVRAYPPACMPYGQEAAPEGNSKLDR